MYLEEIRFDSILKEEEVRCSKVGYAKEKGKCVDSSGHLGKA